MKIPCSGYVYYVLEESSTIYHLRDFKYHNHASIWLRRKFNALLLVHTRMLDAAMMLQPRSPRSPKAGFLHGSLKEEVHAGPLCKPCFAKETIGKTTLFLVFWYLANFIYES